MNEKKVVIFMLDEVEFAVDIQHVERIIDYSKPTRIPETPSYIEGVIAYQDKVIPVINLKKRLGMQEHGSNVQDKIIVIKQDKKDSGIIVDAVSEIRDIDGKSIELSPDIIQDIDNKFVGGIVRLGDRVVILIDYSKVILK